MTYLLGTMLIIAGVVLALMASISYMLTIRGNRAALTYGRVGTYGALAIVSITWLLMVSLFLTRRFDIEYVYRYSSSDLGTMLTIAATWAGQPGSFAFWVVCSAIVAALMIGRTRHFEPYVLSILMLLQAGLTALMLISNPFVPLTDPNTGLMPTQLPSDGQGLNPLLDNFWMILHPPVLFVGYALAAVPFAFALSGLLRYDYDGWVPRALPWTLAAWALLGLALFLGAYWAYETLGWGGYWGWDPVENSSLVPWLMLTALLHGMLVQHAHGGLRRTNVILSVVTYMLVFYATFLTRSGVLTNFSVHSFITEGLSEAMLAFLALIIVGSIVVLAKRWNDMPAKPLNTAFFSRDSFLVLSIVTLAVLSVVISFGTSMPVISAIPNVGHSLQQFFGAAFEIDDGTALGGVPLEDGRFSLMPSFYEHTTPPLGIVLLLLLTVSPLIGWRDVNLQHVFLRGMRWPFLAAVATTIVAMLLGVRDILSLAFVFLSMVAIGTNVMLIVRNMRRGWMYTGGYVAHVGLCIMFIGVVGSSVYASPDERVLLTANDDPVSLYGYDLTFQNWEQTPDGKGMLNLTVQRGNDTFDARPQLYFSSQMNSTMQTPAIKTTLTHDLYIAPVEYIREDNPNQPILQQQESRVVGPYKIEFESFDVDEHAFEETGVAEVGAKLKVTYENEESIVIPRLKLLPVEDETADLESSFEKVPATLPGGHVVKLRLFDPTRRLVVLQLEGLDLPIDPAQAIVTVSTKPAVLLVWAGMLISVLGGFIAIRRRTIEEVVQPGHRDVRVPDLDAVGEP